MLHSFGPQFDIENIIIQKASMLSDKGFGTY